MRKNFGCQPAIYPMPVLIIATYGEDGTPNAMNAAWGGISEENRISICLSEDHATTANLIRRGAFTVSMADKAHLAACDYVGIVSATKVPDKFARAGFHAVKSEFVDAPLIEELPMAMECRVISYDPETCTLIGEIVNVCAEESILNEKGKVDPCKLQPLTFDPMNHTYIVLGDAVGKAFHDGLSIKA